MTIEENLKTAINTDGVVLDRFVFRLGKDNGEFEAWHLPAEDFADDFAGFLACLALRRIVDSIDIRIKDRKKIVKAAKKAARVVQKAAEKAAEKVRKDEEKAAAKIIREAEKKRIKDEAKAERERLKAQVKAEKENPSLPSTEVKSQNVNSFNSGPCEGGAEVYRAQETPAPALSVVDYDEAPVFKPIAIPED